MKRYTIRSTAAQAAPLIAETYLSPAENGYAGPAAERLARLEELYEQLSKNQESLARELETLRLAGKTRTTKFQQLLAKKLTEKNMIVLLDTFVFDAVGGAQAL